MRSNYFSHSAILSSTPKTFKNNFAMKSATEYHSGAVATNRIKPIKDII